MRRFLISIALALVSTAVYAQTAISMPSYTTAASVAAPYWVPVNISVSQGAVSFCMTGYVSKTAMQAGALPVPGAEHCYSSQSGSTVGYIPPATYSSYWPSSLTLASVNAAAVSTALAVADIPTPGTQWVWQPNTQVAVGFTIYASGHFQKVTTAGWTGLSAPTWNSSGGTTTETLFHTPAAVWTDQSASVAASSFFAGGTTTN
jgi:hypothetical protein